MTTRTACDECRTYNTHLPSCSAGNGTTPTVAVFDRKGREAADKEQR